VATRPDVAEVIAEVIEPIAEPIADEGGGVLRLASFIFSTCAAKSSESESDS
jgi:hypothetical protein